MHHRFYLPNRIGGDPLQTVVLPVRAARSSGFPVRAANPSEQGALRRWVSACSSSFLMISSTSSSLITAPHESLSMEMKVGRFEVVGRA